MFTLINSMYGPFKVVYQHILTMCIDICPEMGCKVMNEDMVCISREKVHAGDLRRMGVRKCLFLLMAFIALAIDAAVTVNGMSVSGGALPSGASWKSPKLELRDGTFILSGASTNADFMIVCDGGTANVVFHGLSIANKTSRFCGFALTNSANVVLSLVGNNTLTSGYYRAGLEVPAGCTLTITNRTGETAGTLIAHGGGYAAGIGGGYKSESGTIVICGGDVTAICGSSGKSDSGAGIGGGYYASATVITINDGTVRAYGCDEGNNGYGAGAGIGGGLLGDGGTITINGGSVTAIGGGAGIGGGRGGDGGTITINDGTIIAEAASSDSAGIGGGNNMYASVVEGSTIRVNRGDSGFIVINGGNVTAIGHGYGAGIGTGGHWHQRSKGRLEISGGTVTATGGRQSAGIGGGNYSPPMDIHISGGIVRAETSAGGSYGASGIGGGYNGAGGNIMISGGTVVATGTRSSKDIGAGENGARGQLVVTGGSVIGSRGASYVDSPTNLTGSVLSCTAISGLSTGVRVKAQGVPSYYGQNDIYADANGKVYVWCPQGTTPTAVEAKTFTVSLTGYDRLSILNACEVGRDGMSFMSFPDDTVKFILVCSNPDIIFPCRKARLGTAELSFCNGDEVDYTITRASSGCFSFFIGDASALEGEEAYGLAATAILDAVTADEGESSEDVQRRRMAVETRIDRLTNATVSAANVAKWIERHGFSLNDIAGANEIDLSWGLDSSLFKAEPTVRFCGFEPGITTNEGFAAYRLDFLIYDGTVPVVPSSAEMSRRYIWTLLECSSSLTDWYDCRMDFLTDETALPRISENGRISVEVFLPVSAKRVFFRVLK